MNNPRRLTLACLTGAVVFAACSDRTPPAPTQSVSERDVRGRIHESVPTESVGVAGATVVAVDALGATRTAVTDGAGNFTIQLAEGTATLMVTAESFEAAKIATAIADSGDLSIALVPVRREIVISFSPGGPPPAQLNERHYRLAVHHRGQLRASYTDSSASASAQFLTGLEVRDGGGQVLWRTIGGYDQYARGAVLNVEPGMYDVRFFLTADWSITAWSGVIRHPN